MACFSLKNVSKLFNIHSASFPGVNTEMMMYSYVDPTLVSSAEKDIRNFFKSMGMCLSVDKRREIVVIEKGDVKVVENKFKSVHLLYSGRGGRTS